MMKKSKIIKGCFLRLLLKVLHVASDRLQALSWLA